MAESKKPARGPDKKANRRGAARLAAVQALFQMDIGGAGINDIFAEFESHWLGGEVEGEKYLPAEAAFFRDVVSGVVRGDTIHFEIVSIESSRALMDLAVARKFPLGNGIITVNTEAQAWARARASELNKGGDAARAALAMLRIKRRLTRI